MKSSIILGCMVLASTCSLLSDTNTTSSDTFDKTLYPWLRTYAEALHVLRTRYYLKDVDITDSMIKSINTLISHDPHSGMLSPTSYKELLKSTSGEFYGTGIIIGNKAPEDPFCPIIDTLPGNPGEQAGLKAGDKIIEIDSKSLKGLTTDEVASLLKGERHSKVHITVERANYADPLHCTVTRDAIKNTNELCYYFKEHKVYYFALMLFTQQAAKQVAQMLKRAQDGQARSIILDLRNNAGGLLTAAVDIVSLFVPQDSMVVTTKDRNGTVMEQYTTKSAPVLTQPIPIFILVNNYTASAAEILAGCLRIYADRLNTMTFIVGTTTFGKGSVQEVIPASNDCAFRITTALYYLPDNNTIQGIGIQPDIVINPKFPPSEHILWVHKYFGHECALKNYINPQQDITPPAKTTAHKKEKSLKEQRKEHVMHDYQVQYTLTLINLLDTVKKAYPTIKTRSGYVQKLNDLVAIDKETVIEEVL